MSEHILRSYDEDLGELRSLIESMGAVVLEKVHIAGEALQQFNVGLAERAISTNPTIDDLFRDIEEKTIRMIARRQPVADDLRAIIASLKIASNLDRIGGLAKNTAERCAVMGDRNTDLANVVLPIGGLAKERLRKVLVAFRNNDPSAALSVMECDEELDELYDSAFRQLLSYMLENPRTIGTCTHLLFASKNMESIGDHTADIAENISCVLDSSGYSEPRSKIDATAS